MQFELYETVSALILSYLVGWLMGLIMWILRYLMIDLPRGGQAKGGEKII